MDNLFLALFFISLTSLAVGLIKPDFFSRFIEGEITRKKIVIIFGITTIIFFVLFGITTNSTKQSSEQIAVPQKTAGPSNIQSTEQPKQISYKIIEHWSIPNGGEGEVTVISPDYLNETDMAALGEKLKNDTKNDRNAFIFVFDSEQAASLRNGALDGELNATDQDFYDKHYVGQYNKNGNTGYNEFAIYFDGITGANQKTIKY